MGTSDLPRDLKVQGPVTAWGATPTPSPGIYAFSAVAVLSRMTWTMAPITNISFAARVPLSGMKTVQLLAPPAKKVFVQVAFVIFEYDLASQAYFTSIRSFRGVAPAGAPPLAGFGSTDGMVYALLGKSASDPGIRAGTTPETDPVGINNYELSLTLAPPVAASPQLIQIQTSNTNTLSHPWGLPQL